MTWNYRLKSSATGFVGQSDFVTLGWMANVSYVRITSQAETYLQLFNHTYIITIDDRKFIRLKYV